MLHTDYIYKQYKYELINKLIHITDIPEHYYTNELCEIAINTSSYSIKCIPYEFKTKELCEIAVSNDGWNLQYVPIELRTEKLCNLAMKTRHGADKWAPPGTSVYNNYIMKKALL